MDSNNGATAGSLLLRIDMSRCYPDGVFMGLPDDYEYVCNAPDNDFLDLLFRMELSFPGASVPSYCNSCIVYRCDIASLHCIEGIEEMALERLNSWAENLNAEGFRAVLTLLG